MSEETIKTGIYLNPQTRCLYFVVGLIDNKDTDTKSVSYFPLYQKSDGCCRSLSNFFEKVLPSGERATRMTLLMELERGLKDKLINGSVLYAPERCIVTNANYEEKIFVNIIRCHDCKEIKMSIGDFLYWCTS